MPYTSLSAETLKIQILDSIREKISRASTRPKLCVILVGENQASLTYIRGKEKACESVGMQFELKQFPSHIEESALLQVIEEVNQDDSIHGCIVQLPLPPHIEANRIIDAILPSKDVDGFTKENIWKLYLGRQDGLISCTPLGIMRLLKEYQVDVMGKHVVVLGRSTIVGRPLALLMMHAWATVTLCHSKTEDIKKHTLSADILIVAIGKPRSIGADMVKTGAYVIDVGINRISENTPTGTRSFVTGDVDYQSIIEKAHCSPVPGGVGPMTIALLIANTYAAYEASQNNF
jgi:methylenetetrahydrofolate dehydrogenase (NADP+) / methenyltetrahydrofolate cyclohydrolase